MASANQNETDSQNENTYVPSIDEKSIASETAPVFSIKEPWKLLIQMIYYLSVFIPFTLWAIVSHFFTRSKSIRGNVVLVTGAGRGLGRSLAMKFAELECNVACADVDDINNAETVRLIKQKYPSIKAFAYRCNVALIDDIRNISKNISNDLGEVDIIVNNAGIVSGAGLINFNLDVRYFDMMLDVNLKSHFLMLNEFLPKMIKRNSGHIVAIASLAGLNGLPNASAYAATKHGLVGLMESLHDELRSIPNNKIQTTCVCPYFIATNELYCKYWDLRLPELTVKEVTEATIDAIKRNRRIIAIPSHLYFISIITKLLPDKLSNLQKEIFYTHLSPPEEETANGLKVMIEDSENRQKAQYREAEKLQKGEEPSEFAKKNK